MKSLNNKLDRMLLKLEECTLHYKKLGHGKPLILLHGWGCNLSIFDGLVPTLAKHYELHLFDLPGFGLSSPPQNPYGSAEIANLIIEACQKLQLHPYAILGHSFGGKITLEMAKNGFAERIILIGSAGIKFPLNFKRRLQVWKHKLLKPFLKYSKTLSRFASNCGSTDYRAASGIMRQILVKVVNEDLRYLLPHIKQPALLIWGANDQETPLKAGYTMKELLPKAELIVIPNSGHFPFLEHQKEVLSNVIRFLA